MYYLYDLIIGILVGFLSRFLVDIFYNSNIEITLLVMGILFPCVILGLYSEWRFAIAKEKLSIGLCMFGIIIGLPLEFLSIIPFSQCKILKISEMKGFEILGYGLCRFMLSIMVPIISLVFLLIFTRIRKIARLRYFLDMSIGFISGIAIQLLIIMLYSRDIGAMLWTIVLNSLLSCLLLGLYGMLRHVITKDKPETEIYVFGYISGFILTYEIVLLALTYFPEAQTISRITDEKVFSTLSNELGYGIYAGIHGIVVLGISSLTLRVLFRNKYTGLCSQKEEKRKVEAFGAAFCFPLMGYVFLALTEKKWFLTLFISLAAVSIVYWAAQGKNFLYMLIMYICDTAIFLLYTKVFQFPFPLLPLIVLGGVILLGGVIYKGLEKLLARKES
ncbi:MAG: hypothetical protein HDR01_15860 [Lachnospiraceae bacterium]|nr:hypothetical protein [Lachnospiraceae bacterium]